MSLLLPSTAVPRTAAPEAPATRTAGADSLRSDAMLHGRCVVFLHAHPDDEAIFTGATMRRLADAGARVVLVTATCGELGEPVIPLVPGESLVARRRRELEEAAEVLGVARLVLLGRRDSGMPGWDSNTHPDALATADPGLLACRVAALCRQEDAAALVHYDSYGIYGHPDHVAVHRVGRLAARLAGVADYEATVDREHLSLTGGHLVSRAARSQQTPYGKPAAEITLAVAAGADTLAAKRAAMAAHSSQIPPVALDGPNFTDSYALEWYLRHGPPSILDSLGGAPAAARSGT